MVEDRCCGSCHWWTRRWGVSGDCFYFLNKSKKPFWACSTPTDEIQGKRCQVFKEKK